MSAPAGTDETWMRRAIDLAAEGLGTTAPNPSVGAVLVRFDGAAGGVEIACGATQPGGRPHAETVAIEAAGPAARGATLYVTLEPCSHHGKTPPCAEAVIAAGIARVVVGIEDPDPRVAGRGIGMLRAASIEIELGVEALACRRVTLGHILRVTEARPAVLVKMALDSAYRVPRGGDGRPDFVTGPQARAMGHFYRAHSDAILVGAGTVRADDPELTCRLPGQKHRSPRRIVLDARLDALTPASKLARTARDVPVWVLTTVAAPAARLAALTAMGVRVSVLDAGEPEARVRQALRLLADDGITRLLVEGGPTVWATFARAGLIDEAVVFVAGPAGPQSGPVPTFEAMSGLASEPPMTLLDAGMVGADGYFRFERCAGLSAVS